MRTPGQCDIHTIGGGLPQCDAMRTCGETGHRTRFASSSAFAHALSAIAGCVHEAQYTAVEMNVLGGGGTPADRKRPEHRDSLTEEDTARGRTQTRIRYCPAHSEGTSPQSGERTRHAKRHAGRVATKLHQAELSAQRDGRDAARIRRWCFARSAMHAGRQQVGQSDRMLFPCIWLIGWNR
jgi:hypothetical protein